METPTIVSAADTQQLAGAFLVSPLPSLDVEDKRVRLYSIRCSVDMLSSRVVREHGKCLAECVDGELHAELRAGMGWSMALDMQGEGAAEGWWGGVGRVVHRVFLTFGQEEVFRDHGVQFAELLRKVGGRGTGKGAGIRKAMLAAANGGPGDVGVD